MVRRFRVTSLACSYALCVIGGSVLFGRFLGSRLLTGVQPALASMKANTALVFVLGGVALHCLHRAGRRAVRTRRALAALSALIAGVTLCEYVFGWNAGVDQLLFLDPGLSAAPGRMSPITASAFLLLNAALLLDGHAPRANVRPSEWLALAAGSIAIVVLLGYLYDLRSLYSLGPYASVALHSGLGFLLYALGLLFARPEWGLMRLVASAGLGGLLIRRLFPAAVCVPILVGWLRLLGQRAGWYGTEFGLALFATSSMLCFSVLVGSTARALQRSDAVRRRVEARYRTQFEAAPEAIVTLDVDRGGFVEANENAERLFGYDRSTLARLDPVALSPPVQPDGRLSAEAARGYIGRALAGERPVFEWLHRTAAGDDIPCEIRLVRLPGGVNLCRGSILDISERKRAEEAKRELEARLHATEDQLRQSQKMEAIGRLAGGVAHDFNNLLSVILGYGELALSALPPGDPTRENLEQMARASERAAKLTAQLLAFSRQQVLSARVVDLNQIIRELADMLRRVIGEDIELTISLRSKSNVRVDPSQIEQVVMNLVVNSRDAMPSGGRLAIQTTDVELDAEYARAQLDLAPGCYVVLAVSDTGCGMDKATREHMFEPFFTTKGQGKGTGLGLSMVFGIVKQSGGNVWVYSEPGKGTTFKIFLPRTEHASDASSDGIAPARTLRGSETILLVEDDDQVRALARTILDRHGYRVLEAASGDDAVRVCEQHAEKIELLLTDVVMPRMSGRELAERLASLRAGMKVLFMSGYTDDAMVHHGVLSSELEFVQKPLLPGPLLTRIRQVLDSDARASLNEGGAQPPVAWRGRFSSGGETRS